MKNICLAGFLKSHVHKICVVNQQRTKDCVTKGASGTPDQPQKDWISLYGSGWLHWLQPHPCVFFPPFWDQDEMTEEDLGLDSKTQRGVKAGEVTCAQCAMPKRKKRPTLGVKIGRPHKRWFIFFGFSVNKGDKKAVKRGMNPFFAQPHYESTAVRFLAKAIRMLPIRMVGSFAGVDGSREAFHHNCAVMA